MSQPPPVLIVGAGIGGLSAAIRLAAAGRAVEVFERAGAPGGKIRTVPSAAGPVDAGPTVLTLRGVLDELFQTAGARLEDHVALSPLDTLARHYWGCGTRLDLMRDPDRTAANVAAAFDARAAAQFTAFTARARRLFRAFDAPMMRAARPSRAALALQVLRDPALLRAMAPHRTLAAHLAGAFDEPRLAQLFGRYATYVGGSPYDTPALLGLIWHAEASGVWRVPGGMGALARGLEAQARALGVQFRYGVDIGAIRRGQGLAVDAPEGPRPAAAVVFNGDPRALATGALGPDVVRAVPPTATEPRSLSAHVLAFAARATGPALAHHTVFFGDDPRAEFDDLSQGRSPRDPTLYVCAQDRGDGGDPGPADRPERFEIIMNAPPGVDDPGGRSRCLTTILSRLAQFGLRFDPPPTVADMTAPADFARLFPESLGALYGRSPSGLTAALRRPLARTRVPGLYLAGGGAHPGAGVPMAALSGRHAAEAIIADLAST